MNVYEGMKGGRGKRRKGKVIKKKVVIQKIGYGHNRHRRHNRRDSYWRRPAYFRPPPIITQPVYNIVERPSTTTDSYDDSSDDSSMVKSVIGIGLIISMITLIIVGLKR
jgi:hypothetical protein